jgi:hypothetical protein
LRVPLCRLLSVFKEASHVYVLLLAVQVKQLLVDALYGADHEQQHVEEALDILRSSLSSVDGDAAQGPAPGSSPAAAAAAGSSQGAQSSSTGAIPTSNCHAAASNGSSNGKGKGAGAARGTSSQAASAV